MVISLSIRRSEVTPSIIRPRTTVIGCDVVGDVMMCGARQVNLVPPVSDSDVHGCIR